MNALKLTLVIVVTIALQAGLLPAWRPLGVVPNVVAAVVIVLALIATASQALICAMVTGLVLDLTSAANFGQSLGFYTVLPLAIALLIRFGIAFDSPGWRYGLGILAIIAGQGIIIIELALAHVSLPLSIVAGKLALGILYEIVIMTAVRPLVGRLVTDRGEMSLEVLR